MKRSPLAGKPDESSQPAWAWLQARPLTWWRSMTLTDSIASPMLLTACGSSGTVRPLPSKPFAISCLSTRSTSQSHGEDLPEVRHWKGG